MTDKPKPNPTRPIGYTSCCDVWAATKSKHREGCPEADPDPAEERGGVDPVERQQILAAVAWLCQAKTVVETSTAFVAERIRANRHLMGLVDALLAERDALETRNTELTADFHRVQNELDVAEQDRDALRAEVAELKAGDAFVLGQELDMMRTERDVAIARAEAAEARLAEADATAR